MGLISYADNVVWGLIAPAFGRSFVMVPMDNVARCTVCGFELEYEALRSAFVDDDWATLCEKREVHEIAHKLANG